MSRASLTACRISCKHTFSHERCCTSWWCNDTEMLSALLALCEGNTPVTTKFPSQRSSNGELLFPQLLVWASCSTNSLVASDLRCHGTHVTSLWWTITEVSQGSPRVTFSSSLPAWLLSAPHHPRWLLPCYIFNRASSLIELAQILWKTEWWVSARKM